VAVVVEKELLQDMVLVVPDLFEQSFVGEGNVRGEKSRREKCADHIMTWTDGSACSSGAKMETSPSKNIVGVVCSLVPDTIGLLVFADRTIPRPQHSRDHSRQWALSLLQQTASEQH